MVICLINLGIPPAVGQARIEGFRNSLILNFLNHNSSLDCLVSTEQANESIILYNVCT